MTVRRTEDGLDVVWTATGARLVQNGAVLSEVCAHPGPTHDVFDVLAALIIMLCKGDEVAILGFAAGGLVAPLRQLGGHHHLRGVDLDSMRFELFEEVTGSWVEPVDFDEADACEWLVAQSRAFDFVLDDLSVGRDDDVFKPACSYEQLPSLGRAALTELGVYVCNALPSDGASWPALIGALGEPFGPGIQVSLTDYENRIFVFSRRPLPEPRAFGTQLRSWLRKLGSQMRGQVKIRRVA